MGTKKSGWWGPRRPIYWPAYKSQRQGAGKRNIPFLLTYEQWLKIWVDSGHLHERGQKRGQYCMARFEDQGPYAIGNVKIILSTDNTREWMARTDGHLSEEHKQKISRTKTGYICSEEHCKNVSLGNMGRTFSVETRKKMGIAISLAKKGIPWSAARREAQNRRKT